jgi:hypothetical protein
MVVICGGQTQKRHMVGVGVVPTFPTGNVQDSITPRGLEATYWMAVGGPLVTCRLVDDYLEIGK